MPSGIYFNGVGDGGGGGGGGGGIRVKLSCLRGGNQLLLHHRLRSPCRRRRRYNQTGDKCVLRSSPLKGNDGMGVYEGFWNIVRLKVCSAEERSKG